MSSCADNTPLDDVSILTDTFLLGIPDAVDVVVPQLRRAAQQFFKDSKRWRNDFLNLSVSPAATSYSVDTTPQNGIRVMEILDVIGENPTDPSGDGRIPSQAQVFQEHGQSAQNCDQWWYSSVPSKIDFNQPFKKSQQVRLVGLLVPAPNKCDPYLLEMYRETIVCLAQYYAYSMTDQDWSSPREARKKLTMYEKDLALAQLHFTQDMRPHRRSYSRMASLRPGRAANNQR